MAEAGLAGSEAGLQRVAMSILIRPHPSPTTEAIAPARRQHILIFCFALLREPPALKSRYLLCGMEHSRDLERRGVTSRNRHPAGAPEPKLLTTSFLQPRTPPAEHKMRR